MEKGEGQKYRGKTLDEINISANDLVSDEDENEADDDLQEKDSSPDLDLINELNTEEPRSVIKKQMLNKNIKIIPWTDNEKQIMTKHFKNNIFLNKAPKKHECENFAKQNKINKPWKKIKDFVHNAANSYKNKNLK